MAGPQGAVSSGKALSALRVGSDKGCRSLEALRLEKRQREVGVVLVAWLRGSIGPHCVFGGVSGAVDLSRKSGVVLVLRTVASVWVYGISTWWDSRHVQETSG